MLLKISELAKRTGLTVRTLHHYDAIGLLHPSSRSEAGYRLYNRNDIARLHRIQALRRLDLPLAEVAGLLEGGSADLHSVIEQQIAALDLQAARTVALRDRLQDLRTRLANNVEPDFGDWLATLEMMTMYDKYFSREELASLRRHGKAAKAELDTLALAVRSLIERGIPPSHADAVALARPWLILTLAHMAGDARLILKLGAMHRNESSVQALTGVDGALLGYMIDASAEFRLNLYARHLGAARVATIREPYLAHYREWPTLFAEARELHDSRAAPLGPAVLDLCTRWIALARAVWGDDPALRLRALAVHDAEPDIMLGSGMDGEVMNMVQGGIRHLAAYIQQEQT
jgi:MerR family transcriptional regulator, thiopeptide resistance regulator